MGGDVKRGGGGEEMEVREGRKGGGRGRGGGGWVGGSLLTQLLPGAQTRAGTLEEDRGAEFPGDGAAVTDSGVEG